jgi:hypothetical protein
MHYCSFAVAVVQSEECGSWGTESITGEFEILDHQLAFWAVRSIDQDGRQDLERKNHHEISYGFPELQCAASLSCAP